MPPTGIRRRTCPGTLACRGDGSGLVLPALDKLVEPAGLVALNNAAIAARLPRVDLPELLLEMHARTGFAASPFPARSAAA